MSPLPIQKPLPLQRNSVERSMLLRRKNELRCFYVTRTTKTDGRHDRPTMSHRQTAVLQSGGTILFRSQRHSDG